MAASLKSRLPEIAASLRPRVGAGVKAGAELIAGRAAAKAPDRTPFGAGLVASIHTERKGAAEYAVIAGDEDVFYGHFVEFGTEAGKRGYPTPAQPFLIPAAEESVEEIEALVTGVLRGL